MPEETINHVKKYLNACYATGELQNVLANYNSSRMNTVFLVKGGSGKNNVQLAETEINAGFNLNIIADELDVEVDKLLSWNPNINDELQKKGEGTLYLPTDLFICRPPKSFLVLRLCTKFRIYIHICDQ